MQEIIQAIRAEIGPRKLQYHIETYGCQMNERDSEVFSALLSEMGYTPATDKMTADLLLYNTCCVREHAEKRVFGNIGMLAARKAEKPGLIVGVCGCMMQQAAVAKKLYRRFPFVDLIFGTSRAKELPRMLSEVLNGSRVLNVKEPTEEIAEGLPSKRKDSHAAFVNIMYGCDNFCAYCIVPYVRGRERSRTASDICAEIAQLAQNGTTEITLLGQNVNSYANGFPELLRQVNDIPGLRRIRFMSSHPKDFSDELINAMAALPKVCPHVHLPLQSGSDAVLFAMNRKYSAAQYKEIIRKLRESVPGIAITTDIIIGFPGETDADFADTLALVEELRFDAAFTFAYSLRSGTKAATMENQVPEHIKKERLYKLIETVNRISAELGQKYIGLEGEVLVEGRDDRNPETVFGKLGNARMVYFPDKDAKQGDYIGVRVTGARSNSLAGERVYG
ncbi:MAG: tRNA (N6-isopentenyl adenosine(37)-C2)-methylthiotransferase MiaB [Clostridiales bacterium]|nr:tRNA (N6-isopentenyl adenosine(37)-C2)-methylthiotransferase MiaB [Clostridiales bacterium]